MLVLGSISSAINNLSVFSESHNNIQRIRALGFILRSHPLRTNTHTHTHAHKPPQENDCVDGHKRKSQI